MKHLIRIVALLLVVLLAANQGYGQTVSGSTAPGPVGGTSKLALEYYKINFTREQKQALRGQELEFIYSVDTLGVAVLEKVNGISDEAILDSLHQVTGRLPLFHPYTVDGEKQNAVYFMQLTFPEYQGAGSLLFMQDLNRYRGAKYDDFEYIHTTGDRIDILFGAVGNTFAGKPGDYLAAGGGMKIDLLYVGKEGYGGGMVMTIYGNRLKQNYPIDSNRQPNSAPPTLMIGLEGSRQLFTSERSEFNVQLELTYAVQNITPKLDVQDNDWVQLKGFSPGLVGNYLVRIGKKKPSISYGSMAVADHNINFHGAVRPVFFDLKEASGIMLELGLSYRWRYHVVDDFRLKPEFGR